MRYFDVLGGQIFVNKLVLVKMVKLTEKLESYLANLSLRKSVPLIGKTVQIFAV